MKLFVNHALACLASAVLCCTLNAQNRDKPWMMGFKTNLLSDAAVLPNMGFEIQIAEHLSLDVIATYTEDNVFFPDKNTKVYGFTPELRYWMDDAMHKGHFFGFHANTLWYTTKWSDGFLYQNISNSRPAWSVGATYGYNLRLDKKNHWGIEFFLGIGYAQYTQDVGEWDANDQKWYSVGIDDKQYIGVTRIGVNLSYRFFMRRAGVGNEMF